MKTIAIAAVISSILLYCAAMTRVFNKARKAIDPAVAAAPLIKTSINKAVSEAANFETKNALRLNISLYGFYKTQGIFTHFHSKAIKLKGTIEILGLKSLLKQFLMALNRPAAITAAKKIPFMTKKNKFLKDKLSTKAIEHLFFSRQKKILIGLLPVLQKK